MVYPGLGKEPPGFYGNETLESQTMFSVLRPITSLAIVSGPHRPKCSLYFDKTLTPASNAPTSATTTG